MVLHRSVNIITGMHYLYYDSVGHIYTGLADGRIIRLSKDFDSFETIVRTGKPPFDKCGKV